MSIVAERMELIDEIDRLNKLHPPFGEKQRCEMPNCTICPKIRELGKHYEFLTLQKRQKRRDAYNQEVIEKKKKDIFAKGGDATRSDIEFLINVAKMPKREIAPKLGISNNMFLDTCKAWE